MSAKAPPSPPFSRHAVAYVLAGGRGSRLMELTDNRAKPAVFFGGKSRIVDFALSNALNSGIRRVAVATQYKAHSLIRHLQNGWNFFRHERNESFDILPASQRISENMWYLGTADAVYQNIDIMEGYGARYMVVLAGDHIYKMDYEKMLQQHVEQEADVTIACIEVPRQEAVGFGVMHVDEKDRIISFLEKPKDPAGDAGQAQRGPGQHGASMSSTWTFWPNNCAATPKTATPAMTSARTSFRTSSRTAKPWRTISPAPACARMRRPRPIGATWERWMPIGRRISI